MAPPPAGREPAAPAARCRPRERRLSDSTTSEPEPGLQPAQRERGHGARAGHARWRARTSRAPGPVSSARSAPTGDAVEAQQRARGHVGHLGERRVPRQGQLDARARRARPPPRSPPLQSAPPAASTSGGLRIAPVGRVSGATPRTRRRRPRHRRRAAPRRRAAAGSGPRAAPRRAGGAQRTRRRRRRRTPRPAAAPRPPGRPGPRARARRAAARTPSTFGTSCVPTRIGTMSSSVTFGRAHDPRRDRDQDLRLVHLLLPVVAEQLADDRGCC